MRGVVSFCTEGMAKDLLFLPYEMAPGHLIDLRDFDEAVKRMGKRDSDFNEAMDFAGEPEQDIPAMDGTLVPMLLKRDVWLDDGRCSAGTVVEVNPELAKIMAEAGSAGYV